MRYGIGLLAGLLLTQVGCVHTEPPAALNDSTAPHAPLQAQGAAKVWACLEQISSYSEGGAAATEWNQTAPFSESNPYYFALIFEHSGKVPAKVYLEDMRAKLYEVKYDGQMGKTNCTNSEDTDDDFFCFSFALPVPPHPIVEIEAVSVAKQFKITRIESPNSKTAKNQLIPLTQKDQSLVARDVEERLENMGAEVTGIMNEVPQDLANNMDEDIKKLKPECQQAIAVYNKQFAQLNVKP